MKRKALAIVLTLLMLVSVLPMGAFAASYTDTEGHWAETSIDRWTDAKVLEGMGNNTYAPDDHLTRAQAMTIFSRLLNLVETADISALTDVSADAWYAPYIEKGYAYEIIKGTSDTTFDPSGSITREQFFSIFARATGIPGASTCDKTFTDLNQVSSWFVEEGTVYSMINRGYLDGYPDGSLQPKGLITRAEVAKVLDNAISDYITADGTYAISGDGIVVVLAKNVKLTGTFTGHIVSSCVDAVLDLSGLTKPAAKVALNVAADNVTVNGTGVANPPYTPDSPYNPNSAPYVYVLQDNTKIVYATSGGGGGGGGGGGSSDNYVVTASMTVPFGKTPVLLKAGPYTSDQSLQTVLSDLGANNKDAVKQGVQDAFNKITATKTHTYGDYTITVAPVAGEDGSVASFTASMLDKAGNPVNLQNVLNDESALYQSAVAKKAATAGVEGKDGWADFSTGIDPINFFTFSADGYTMYSLTAEDYAGIFCDALANLSKLSAALGTSYDYAGNMNKVLGGGHWDGYNVIGTGFSSMNAVLQNDVVLAKALTVNGGKIIEISESPTDVASMVDAVNRLTGRNYAMSPEVQAMFEAGTTNVGSTIDGDYIFTVTVTNN